MNHRTPGLPVHNQLLESTQTHVRRVSDAIQPSHPLSPISLLLSVFPKIRVFSNESPLRMRWPKDWSFSSNISPSNEHSGLISFRMDWLDLLAVQGTQGPLSMGFSRQEYWSGLPFPSPGGLPAQGWSLRLMSPELAGMFFHHQRHLGISKKVPTGV